MNGDYNDQNHQNQNGQYGANGQSPYGNGGNFYREQGYGPQGYNQQPPYWNAPDPRGESAQTLGIVSIICAVFCAIAGLIIGIIAMNRAKESQVMLQYETSAAKTGRICGLVGVIIAAISMIGGLAGSVLLALGMGAAMM